MTRYSIGSAIAITTYSAIFNLNSHLGDAQTLVFDDAHAAEGYVAEAWAVSINRADGAYERLLDIFSDTVEPAFIARMVAPGDLGDNNEVRLLPIAAVARHIAEINTELSCVTGPNSYRINMLRDGLASCLFYVSRREIYVRPMIPPTFQHAPFTQATQRLYLSATLGDGGELERAFGRSGIRRMAVPPAWDKSGSGRRFFVFPELAPDHDAPRQGRRSAEEAQLPATEAAGPPVVSATPGPDAGAVAAPPPEGERMPAAGLVADLLDLADKRLILTPDALSASQIADAIGVANEDRFVPGHDDNLQPFIEAAKGTLLAPNRYDGMDLAADSCRMMLMAGLPKASHLQDRFLETKLGATEVLVERVRTRVLQGAGRCTRGPKDWAVVVVYGAELLRFLSRTEIRESFPVELQAEIKFGLDQTGTPASDLVMLAESALSQDEVWRDDAEPELAALRRSAERRRQPDAENLAASAEREVEVWALAWQQDWESASRATVSVLEQLTGPRLRPYRALWAYLGSAWSKLSYDATGDAVALERSAELLRRAQAAAAGTTWLKEATPHASEPIDSEPVDEAAVEQVITLIQGRLKSPTKYMKISSEMLVALHQTKSEPYELGLVSLGELLGAAESFKPPGKGRADAVWVWDTMWITVEAKSEQTEDGALSMDYVRQTNTHLSSVAADRGAEERPEASISVVMSPRGVVDPDAVVIAEPQVHLADPKLIQDIAHDADRAWKQLRGIAPGVSGDALHREAAQILWDHRVLPTQVRERLTRNPIRRA